MFGYVQRNFGAHPFFSHLILRKMAKFARHTEAPVTSDCKSQVAMKYEDGQMVGIKNVVILSMRKMLIMKPFVVHWEEIAIPSLPAELLSSSTIFSLIRSIHCGGRKATRGWPVEDIVDTYGGWGRHGGGAFREKIPVESIVLPLTCVDGLQKMWLPLRWRDRVEIRRLCNRSSWPHEYHHWLFWNRKGTRGSNQNAIYETFNFKPAEIVGQLDHQTYYETPLTMDISANDLPGANKPSRCFAKAVS